jgi:hypothetical protein
MLTIALWNFGNSSSNKPVDALFENNMINNATSRTKDLVVWENFATSTIRNLTIVNCTTPGYGFMLLIVST